MEASAEQAAAGNAAGSYSFELEHSDINPTHKLIVNGADIAFQSMASGGRRRRSNTSKPSKKRATRRCRSSKRMSRKMNKRRR